MDKDSKVKLDPAANPKAIAAAMTKVRWNRTRGGFGRRVEYPDWGWL